MSMRVTQLSDYRPGWIPAIAGIQPGMSASELETRRKLQIA